MNYTLRLGVTMIQLVSGLMSIFWLSVFVYLCFYYAYVPTVMNSREVYVQYDSRCDPRADTPARGRSCAAPYANIAFGPYDLARGQMYRFTLDIRMPESSVNWDQGMMMVRLKLSDRKANQVLNVARATGLKYKSTALRYIHILFYWPLLVLGLAEESQQITVTLIDNYVEGSHPGVGGPYEAQIVFEARDVHIYPPTVLRVMATLSGLSYYMYHHWIISFFVGTTSIASFFSLLALLFFFRHAAKPENHENNNGDDNDQLGTGVEPDTSGLTGSLEPEIEREAEQHMQEMDALAEETDRLAESLAEEMEESNESDVSSTVVITELDDTIVAQ